MIGRALIAALALSAVSSCGGTDTTPSPPKATYAHDNVEACSAINHLFVNGEDESTVPPDIKAVIDGSPLRDTWATYYRALLVWADTGTATPEQEGVQNTLDAAEKVLRQTCLESKIKIVGADQQYFLPDY